MSLNYFTLQRYTFSPHIASAVGRCANKSMNVGFFVGKLGKSAIPPQLKVHFLHLGVGLQVVGYLVRGEDGYVIHRRPRLCSAYSHRQGTCFQHLSADDFEIIFSVQRKYKKTLRTFTIRSVSSSVPGAGIEPARVLPHRFLRPTRLPIPPPGHRCFFRLQNYNFFYIPHTPRRKFFFM